MTITIHRRGSLDSPEANALHAEAFETRLVDVATERARAADCEWLHVDFDDELRPFYLDACGFTPTDAGLERL